MVQGVIIEDGHILDINPSTEELIERVPCTPLTEIPTLIQNSKKAQASWAKIPLEKRIESLKKAVRTVAKESEALARIMTLEMGKIQSEAKEEVEGCCDKDEFLDLIREANEDEVLGDSVVVREPHGVVLVLSPWNFPADEIMLLALPALAAGNAVIVKPSEVVPLTGKTVVNALRSALPPDVVQLTQGDGTVGAALVNAAGVDMVAMTGSSAVGRKIMTSSSPDLKRLVLELGGKDPMIVFGDADLDKAVDDAVKCSLYNTGQVCCSVERIYVEDSIKGEFEKKAVELARQYKVGDGMDAASKVGPLVSKMQREHVEQQIEDCIQNGGTMLYQGDKPPTSDKGYFHPVTVLTDLTQNMSIQKHETFGPVIAISAFDGTVQNAIHLANDTQYGLASYVYTSDKEKAKETAMGIRSGQVGINCYSLFHAHSACPWVGHKGSGFGYHSGMDGFRQFSLPKSLVWSGAS